MSTKTTDITHSNLKRERVATECVCCESKDLKKSPAILMPFVAHLVFGWTPVEIDDSWGLKTIQNGTAYTICNSLYCINCELLFLDIRFSQSELNSLYDGYRNEQYSDLRENYEPGYKQRNNALNAGINYISDIKTFLTPHLNFPLSILDWGGDTCKNTPFKEQNKLFHIFDISSKAFLYGAQAIDKNTALTTDYDLIVCSNVLEHVPYPSQLISDIKNAMGEDTLLYIEVPMEDIIRVSKHGSDLSKMKKHWHEHINFFSENSLIKLFNICGLIVVALRILNASAGGGGGQLIYSKLHVK
jgi:hypothetical protein